MEATCMQLSIEGERALKAQDYKAAIEYFEAGLRVGTDDNEVLSAVYNQLGNACFYVGQFHKALEYHKKDLEIAEKLGDRQGMAKAFGNLGNTFKSLKNYPNAIRCCEAHLEITRELKDRLGEGRACYNLGNVYHAMGKASLAQKDARKVAEGTASVNKAIEYYKAALDITAELKDVAGEGRAVGNLGNAYTAIGKYEEAITYHERRLAIATRANDLPAQARACGNLGNAYSALGDYTQAIRYYQQSLGVARESNNKPGVGQAYYCLGCTYGMQKNFVKAIEFHQKHLEVAEQLKDKNGKLRALHNLRNTYYQMGDEETAKTYHRQIRALQPNARAMPAHLQKDQRAGQGTDSQSGVKNGSMSPKEKAKKKQKKRKPAKTGEVQAFSADESSDEDEVITSRGGDSKGGQSKQTGNSAMEWLHTAVEESKTKPIEPDTTFGPSSSAPPQPTEEGQGMDFIDMLMEAQTSRLDDQRSEMPAIGAVPAHAAVPQEHLDQQEEFFDMLISAQEHRLDDQRTSSTAAEPRNVAPQAQEVATPQKDSKGDLDEDTMSFFEMLAVAKKGKGK